MSSRIKIINILPLPPPNGFFKGASPSKYPIGLSPIDKKNAVRIPQAPYWVVFDVTDGFHVRLSSSIIDKTDRYEIECWSLYENIDRIYTKKINGIKHKIFPSSKKRISLSRIQYPSLISTLKKEINKNKVIIHLHGLHLPTMIPIYLWANFSKVPVVATHRGSASPFFLLNKKPWAINRFLVEQLTFPDIDFFFAQSRIEFDFLSKRYGRSKVLHFQDGIDFSVIKPIDRLAARKRLGLSESQKVLLYVGHFASNKPAKTLLTIYPELYSRGIEVYFVGGFSNHDLYSEIKNTVPTSFDRMPIKDLILYYSAADIHVYPSDDLNFTKFSSIANANIEALACDTPIYTSQLDHFLGSNREQASVGINSHLVKNKSKVVQDLLKMFDNLDTYKNCREIAKKYYDRSENCIKVIKVYNQLAEKYYA